MTGRGRFAAFIGGFVLLALLGGGAYAYGWLPASAAPRRLVVRGCLLTQPAQVTDLLDCTGREALPTLWLSARRLTGSERKWLRGASVRPAWYRSAVVEVTERRPLLLVVGGGAHYWLCDDGRLVRREDADTGAVFQRVTQLPKAALAYDPGPGPLDASTELLTLAASCARFMPGQIVKIDQARDGTVRLYDQSGFAILLGEPVRLTERIAALPKALRICEGHKHRLRYLDATDTTDPLVFYQKWKGPAKLAQSSN